MIQAWLAKTGAWLTGIFALVMGALYIHKSSKREAVKDALEIERQRIRANTAEQIDDIREQANEIDADVADADLHQRMRDQAKD